MPVTVLPGRPRLRSACWGRGTRRGNGTGGRGRPGLPAEIWGRSHGGSVVSSSSRSPSLGSTEPSRELPELGRPARGCTRSPGSAAAALAVAGSQDPSPPQARGRSASQGLRRGRNPAASRGASAERGGSGVPGESPSGCPGPPAPPNLSSASFRALLPPPPRLTASFSGEIEHLPCSTGACAAPGEGCFGSRAKTCR